MVAESSQPILDCMLFRGGDHLLAHNFYTNKMDATAYNDIDAVPRHTLTKGLNDHAGSRQRLLFTRKEIVRCDTTAKLNKVTSDAHPSHQSIHHIQSNPLSPNLVLQLSHLAQALDARPMPNTRRTNMITNPAVENS